MDVGRGLVGSFQALAQVRPARGHAQHTASRCNQIARGGVEFGAGVKHSGTRYILYAADDMAGGKGSGISFRRHDDASRRFG